MEVLVMTRHLKELNKDQLESVIGGATAIEYQLIAAQIALTIVNAEQGLNISLGNRLANDSLANAAPSLPGKEEAVSHQPS